MVAVDIEQEIRSSFQLDGVRDTQVHRNQAADFSVHICMSRFDAESRLPVYAAQRALYAEHPTVNFEFHVIDVSERVADTVEE